MNLYYKLGWRFFRLVFKTYFRWRVYNPERVPAQGPVLLVSNHASYLDPPLVGASLTREISFLARGSLFEKPLFRTLLPRLNAIPIERDGIGIQGLKNTLKVLAANRAVVVFAEGTRSPDGEIHPPQGGAGLTIVKSAAWVVPVRLFGTFEAFGRHHRWPRPRQVTVKYGLPMSFEQERASARQATGRDLKAIYQEAADAVMNAIAELKPEADPPEAHAHVADPVSKTD